MINNSKWKLANTHQQQDQVQTKIINHNTTCDRIRKISARRQTICFARLRVFVVLGCVAMRRNWAGSAADPLWVASEGMERGAGSGRRETAVDESRKETADRVARYQTDYVGRTCLCYSYHKPLRLPRMCFCWASVFLSFPFTLGRIMFMLYLIIFNYFEVLFLMFFFVCLLFAPFVFLFVNESGLLYFVFFVSTTIARHCIVYSAYCITT